MQISNAPAALSTDGSTTANAVTAAFANAAARGRSLTAPADLELELEQLLTQVDGSGLPLLPSEQAALERPALGLWTGRSAARLAGPASARSLHTTAAADAAAAGAAGVSSVDAGSVGFPTASADMTTGGLGSPAAMSAAADASGIDTGISSSNPNPNMLNPELDNTAFAAAAARTAAKQAFDPEGAAAAGMPLSTQVPDGHGGLAGTVGGASPQVQYGGAYQHSQRERQPQQPYGGASSSNYGARSDDGNMSSGGGNSLRGIASAVGSAAAVGANIMQLGATVAGSVAETVASAGANVVREGLRTAAMPLQGAAAALDAAARSLQSQGGPLHGGGGQQHGQQGMAMAHHDDVRIPRNDDHYDARVHGGHHNLGEAPHAAAYHDASAGRAYRHEDALHHHDAVRHDVAGAAIGAAPRTGMMEPASGLSSGRAGSGAVAGSMMPRSGGLLDPQSRLFSTLSQTQAQVQAHAAALRMRVGRARASTLPSSLPSTALLRGLHTAGVPWVAAAAAGSAGGKVTERDAHAASGADYSGVAALSTDEAQAEARAYAAGQRQRSGSPSAGMRVAGIRSGQQPDAADTAQPGMTADAPAAKPEGSGADSAQLTERGDVSDGMPSQAVTSESPSTAERSCRMAQHSKPGPAGADALGRNRDANAYGKKAASATTTESMSKSSGEAAQDVYQGGFGGAFQPPPVSKRDSGGLSSSDMESTPLIYGAPAGKSNAGKSAPGRGSSGTGDVSMGGPPRGSGGSRGLHTAAAAAAPPARKPSAADRDEDLEARGGSLVGAHTMASISDLQTIGGESPPSQQVKLETAVAN